jgi:hypothetical protein
MVVLDNLVVTGAAHHPAQPGRQHPGLGGGQRLHPHLRVAAATGAAGDSSVAAVFVIGLAVFTASSATALAPDVNWLIAARAAGIRRRDGAAADADAAIGRRPG